ncbi:hypothetical protein HK100_011208 [Physocladia obscura]|uniref:Uncharacterized protein n=1 Tax=Physocladia obscura TaxID=109957 RepID=A0AAD5T1H2_9FUNG|nr:hypothetical protein HK100_011208 [Physocladia obscura]
MLKNQFSENQVGQSTESPSKTTASTTTTAAVSTSATIAASSSSSPVPTSSKSAAATSTTTSFNSINSGTSTTTNSQASDSTTTTTTAIASSNNGSSVPIGAIAGGIAGAVVLAVIGVFLFKRSQRKKRREDLELDWVGQSGYVPTQSARATPSLPNSAFNREKPVTLRKLEHAPTRSRLAEAAVVPEVPQKEVFSEPPQYYQNQQQVPLPGNASVFTTTAAGPQFVQNPAIAAAYYTQQLQQQPASYQYAPAAGQYPGYYDDQGQYHYYTAEEITQMSQAPPQ